MGNTVGSINVDKLLSDPQLAYILGLWCADGYQRTSSIGLSNSDNDLLVLFSKFLLRILPEDRLRIRAYHPIKIKRPKLPDKLSAITQNIAYYPLEKARQISCHVYVNSRPLLRVFNEAKKNVHQIYQKVIIPYIAGRFDGDGSVDRLRDRDFRIVYGNYEEAKTDQSLLRKIGINNVKIYHYSIAKTFCLYVSRYETAKIIKLLMPFSVYLQKRLAFISRRDLVQN